uniref:Uncharacterized protein n=1 Tax=Anopheles coluzzii TaxID=1518534 RepID=A0A8W7PNS8_ANOCL
MIPAVVVVVVDVVDIADRALDKVDRHLQPVRVLVAVVQNVGTDSHVRHQALLVDLVQRVEHRFQRLYATLRHDRTARDGIFARVHHHETAEDEVTLDHRLPLDGPHRHRAVVFELLQPWCRTAIMLLLVPVLVVLKHQKRLFVLLGCTVGPGRGPWRVVLQPADGRISALMLAGVVALVFHRDRFHARLMMAGHMDIVEQRANSPRHSNM